MTARDRMVVIIVAVVAAIAGSWFLVVQPKRDQASKLGDQATAAQRQLDDARAQVATSLTDRASFATNYTSLARLGEAVPSDDNIPSLIYQLQSAASGASVDFRALTLTSGGTAAPAAAGAANASATQAVTASLPPGAAVGPSGFPTMPFSFTFRGSFFHLSDFFGRLEKFVVAANNHVSVSGRLLTLNAISFGPGKGGFPQIDATISATSYLVPASEGLLAGATPNGPANQVTPAASHSGASLPTPTATVTP